MKLTYEGMVVAKGVVVDGVSGFDWRDFVVEWVGSRRMQGLRREPWERPIGWPRQQASTSCVDGRSESKGKK